MDFTQQDTDHLRELAVKLASGITGEEYLETLREYNTLLLKKIKSKIAKKAA